MVKLPLTDRVQAGRLLAKKVAAAHPGEDAVVLGLPRGGVVVAREVALALNVPWDVMIVRKLGVPGREELGFGAIASGGQQFIDHSLLDSLHVAPDEAESVIQKAEAELARREKLYRRGRRALAVKDKTVILVDDGLATGSTMMVAIRAARQMGAGQVIAAAPVSSRDACELCKSEGASCICLSAPHPFHAVGEWYMDFHEVTEAEVRELLAG